MGTGKGLYSLQSDNTSDGETGFCAEHLIFRQSHIVEATAKTHCDGHGVALLKSLLLSSKLPTTDMAQHCLSHSETLQFVRGGETLQHDATGWCAWGAEKGHQQVT